MGEHLTCNQKVVGSIPTGSTKKGYRSMNDLFDTRDIVLRWLTENGYGGLMEPVGACTCTLDNFAPCASISGWFDGCLAGYVSYLPGDNVKLDPPWFFPFPWSGIKR